MPFAEKAANRFSDRNPDVGIAVSAAGAGGLEKLCAGQAEIGGGPSPIGAAQAAACERDEIAYTHLQVALDGVAVVTADSVDLGCLTLAQVERLRAPGARVRSLRDLGADAETGKPLPDVPPRVRFIGLSAYEESKSELNLVAVDSPAGCVAPSVETIQDGTYRLSRPLLMYPSDAAAARSPALIPFLRSIEGDYEEIADAAGVVPMRAAEAARSRAALAGLAARARG